MLLYQAIKGLLDECIEHEVASQLLNNWVSLSYMAHHISLLVKYQNFNSFWRKIAYRRRFQGVLVTTRPPSSSQRHKTYFQDEHWGKSCSTLHNKMSNLACSAISCWSLYPGSSWGYNNHTPSTKFLLAWSLLNVEYTDLPCLEKKGTILIQYSTSASNEIWIVWLPSHGS